LIVDGVRPEGVALLEDAGVEASAVYAAVEAAVDVAVDEAEAAVDESAGAVAIGATGEALSVTAEREAVGAADDTEAEEAFPEPITSGLTDPPPYTREFWTLAQSFWMVAF